MVIATVFLTIIGMTGGFVLGERHRSTIRTSAETQTQTPDQVVPSTESAPTGPMCPSQTRETAVKLGYSGDLRQVFHIVTDHDNVVWICADPDNNLYYQGKSGGVDAPLVETDNGLFLAQVIKHGAGRYEVIAPSDRNRFEINGKQLIIHHSDGRTEVQNVVGG